MTKKSFALAALLHVALAFPAGAQQAVAPAVASSQTMPASAVPEGDAMLAEPVLAALNKLPDAELHRALDARAKAEPGGAADLYLRQVIAKRLLGAALSIDSLAAPLAIRRDRDASEMQLATSDCTTLMRWDLRAEAISNFQQAVDAARRRAGESVPTRSRTDAAGLQRAVGAQVLEDLRERHQPLFAKDRSLSKAGRDLVAAAVSFASDAVELGAEGADLSDAYLLRGCAWGMKPEPDKAIADIERAAQLDGHRASLFARAGTLRSAAEQWQEAIKDFDRAIALEPTLAEAWAGRGFAQGTIGDRDKARADLSHAVELAPDNGDVRTRYAMMLAAMGDHAKAIDQYDAVIRLRPSYAFAWLHRGIARDALNDHQAAIADYTQVIDHLPGQYVTSARMHRAAAELALGDRAAAAADVAATNDGKPLPNAAAYVDRGADWFTGGDIVRATADFRTAVSMAPADPRAQKFLAAVLEQQHDYPGAEEAYARSLAAAPDEAVANSLARMQMFDGHFAQAADRYRSELEASGARAYLPVWLYLARARANPGDEPAARAELAGFARPHVPPAWTDSLTDFMLGRIDAQALRGIADAAPPDKRAGRRCESDYYAAELLIAHQHAADAAPLLDAAVRGCPAIYYEARAAVAEQRLQGGTAGTQ